MALLTERKAGVAKALTSPKFESHILQSSLNSRGPVENA